MASTESLVDSFWDTQRLIIDDSTLRDSVNVSIRKSKVYGEGKPIRVVCPAKYGSTTISVTSHRTLQAAGLLLKEWPGRKVAVHNFASAVNPGGGVTRGARAQEECPLYSRTFISITASSITSYILTHVSIRPVLSSLRQMRIYPEGFPRQAGMRWM